MAESSNSSSNGGIGFLGALTIVFVAAKLWGKIDWSWWWVFAPLYVPLAIILGLLAIVCVIEAIVRIGDRATGARPSKKFRSRIGSSDWPL